MGASARKGGIARVAAILDLVKLGLIVVFS